MFESIYVQELTSQHCPPHNLQDCKFRLLFLKVFMILRVFLKGRPCSARRIRGRCNPLLLSHASLRHCWTSGCGLRQHPPNPQPAPPTSTWWKGCWRAQGRVGRLEKCPAKSTWANPQKSRTGESWCFRFRRQTSCDRDPFVAPGVRVQSACASCKGGWRG